MLRAVKIVLVALVALWGLIGAFGNLTHLGGTYDAVRTVAAMEGVEGINGGPPSTENSIIVWLGVALIVIGKIAAAVFCGAGAVAMARSAGGSASEFQHAKRLALVGCGAAIVMLFGGFAVIGESFFQMWQTPVGQLAGAGAFRYAGYIALIAIFVGQED